MGRRSDFARNKHDAYDTPPEAVAPLIDHLPAGFFFVEPCAGSGALIRALESHGAVCIEAFDIEPRDGGAHGIKVGDAQALRIRAKQRPRIIVTNPPWTRELLHPMILNLYWQAPTWMLLDAGWIHTRQAAPYLPLCRKVVSVGRLRWIPGSPHTGKDDCAWHLFAPADAPTQFFGRRP